MIDINPQPVFKIKTRLFVQNKLQKDQEIILDVNDGYHLANVLKLQKEDLVSVFNDNSGEYVAKITEPKKNYFKVLILDKIQDYVKKNYSLHIIYAPLKKDATDFLIEKLVEIGVTELTQVITEHTVNNPLELEKLQKKVTQAVKQCGRIDIPKLNPTLKLKELLLNYPKNILWLNEQESELFLSIALRQQQQKDISFLTGPEGGFSKKEQELLRIQQSITSLKIGPRILRAETASLVAATAFQIIIGDFQ